MKDMEALRIKARVSLLPLFLFLATWQAVFSRPWNMHKHLLTQVAIRGPELFGILQRMVGSHLDTVDFLHWCP